MVSHSRAALAAALLASALGAGQALAQAASAPAVSWGPAVPGLCVLSRDQAIGGSAAGASANQQLTQMTQAGNASLQPEAQAIKTEQQTLRSESKTLAPAVLQQRASALNQRIQAYQEKAQAKNKQLADAQAAAAGRIEKEIGAVLPALVASHHCAIVVERGVTFGANPAMDLTPEVITQVNSRLPSVSVSAPAPAR